MCSLTAWISRFPLEATASQSISSAPSIRRNLRGSKELLIKLVFAAGGGGGSTWAGTGYSCGSGKYLCVLKRPQFLPCRLVNTNRIEDRRELVIVLSLVDVMRIVSV